ncbi:condensation domain-containing protein [uncultured Nostoc sp.]|uniref:condensation domain-containing protein n=1 Tax=uncultured Nostoc sp. TaxID=340711 RepID=UPI00260FF91B|nr:condensation domain-containing protein [uncultured Nostoc sp.]
MIDFYQRVDTLCLKKRHLLALRLKQQLATVLARKDVQTHQRLVAYIVPHQGELPRTTDLRYFLEDKLPDYMIPSAFVNLKALPKLPNGKVDIQALPKPELSKTFAAPQTRVEKVLAEIWAQVLVVEQVGIHDNFFELGGDSILSIQIVAKANQAGLQLTPKQLFEHQTIAELAMVTGTTQSIQGEQRLVTGEVALTPIQQWFLLQNQPDSHHWNQSCLLEIPQGHNPKLWEQLLQRLIEHHDALRLRFHFHESGWVQVVSNVKEMRVFQHIDLSTLPEIEQNTAIETVATELQGSLNLSQGTLIRVALFNLGSQKSSRLLIIIHHLAVDGVSWRILLEDLQTVYLQLSQGKSINLPDKTTSFQEWALRLKDYAQSTELIKEQEYWLGQLRKLVSPLPVDYAGGDKTVAKASTVSVSLSREDTQALLQKVHQAYHTQINDVLLTSLVQACAEWTGEHSLLLDMEGHGRNDIFPNINLSRTVGWFACLFPVLLDIEGASSLGNALMTVKEQLRSIPNHGIGYGILRYLSSEDKIRSQLQASPQAEIFFNYLGQTDQVFSQSSMFTPTRECVGPNRSLRGSRVYLLEVAVVVASGQLHVNWTYSEAIHQRTTVEKLANSFIKALRSLITHCQSRQALGFTPSDFPQAKLEQQDLDKFLAKFNQ